MKRPAPPASRSQRGAALLTAMLTVTLVATFAAASLWQQWRAVEIEAAERARVQSAWVLVGALDWSRLILREDARAGGGAGPDHLAEPWAVPLEEAKLSSFLAADKNIASDALEGLPEAFLQGRIVDAQSKLNVMNMVLNGAPVPAEIAVFTKLFEMLGLPVQEVPVLAAQLRRALPPAASAGTGTGTGTGTGAGTAAGSNTGIGAGTGTSAGTGAGTGTQPTTDSSASGPLLPQRTYQLVWLGLSPSTVTALEPYVTILPGRTPLNINTASAEALAASVPSLDLASAKRVVAQRATRYFRSQEDANKVLAQGAGQFNSQQHSVGTNFFEVQGRIRLDNAWVEEHSLLRRDNLELRIIWRERGAGATPIAPNS
ncbi:Type II secretory pathway, component PulK [Variovorax sp. PBS-H4]|uniref:type II secretion system minor pseudopilin GspK n=1 Tax=Variovorax sp. PBS-H4 TaxID=434008 RepID=UPI0013161B37|nr:type II secretion system minor pseudopilin GspK [Variovorax sp. PBS-H4]VTU23736.1 Type II secretory pathway, component PulK [Variovorax sp. PBS-H4]